MKNEPVPTLPPAVLKALRRYVSYGWMPAITSSLLNRQFGLSLKAHDIALILAQPDPFMACEEAENRHDEPENA